MARIIGILSGKGGVGKTTTVANLGTALASQYKKNVIIVDCNITTSHLSLYLGMYYSPVTLNQVLNGKAKIQEAIYDYHVPGLRVIPASLSLKDLRGVDVSRLTRVITKLSDEADIVLLDGAPGMGREAMSTMRASDEVLFISTPFVPSTMDIIKCHQVALEMGTKPLGILLNMVGKERYELTLEEVEQLSELSVITTVPMDKNVLRSLALKTPVVSFDPNSPASKAFLELAGKLIGEKYVPDSFMKRFMRLLGLARKK
ncbi:MAG: cell division ATPase MinD [Candidatus Aenigmatarchaeota archaeon]|nr:MAG: cell division ATPase MinD [Candidatus Aenigmarchaeota archaeon]